MRLRHALAAASIAAAALAPIAAPTAEAHSCTIGVANVSGKVRVAFKCPYGWEGAGAAAFRSTEFNVTYYRYASIAPFGATYYVWSYPGDSYRGATIDAWRA